MTIATSGRSPTARRSDRAARVRRDPSLARERPAASACSSSRASRASRGAASRAAFATSACSRNSFTPSRYSRA